MFFGADLAEPGFEILAQVINDGTGLFVVDAAAVGSTGATHLVLDGVEPGEARRHSTDRP